MIPDSIKKTKKASTTLSFFGVLSTYELYSVDKGDDVDDDDDAVELRAFEEAAEEGALDPFGGMMYV